MERAQEFLLKLSLSLDGIVYTFVNWVYQIILAIANQNIFGNSNIMDNFMQRIYVILGVIMMFVLAYSLLKSMINPDELAKGKNSPVKIISNTIIALAIITLTPAVFDFAMRFQTSLLQENTIGKIIVGSSTGDEVNTTINQGGREMAVGVLNAFIFPNDNKYCKSYAEEQASTSGTLDCEIIEIDNTTYGQTMSKAVNVDLIKALPALSEAMIGDDAQLTYYWIVSAIAGAFVLMVLITYCIEIAIRMIKLAVYQFIAPIPALAKVMPNEQANKVFGNWLKACISTYLEVFIRLGLLFFAVFIISVIREQITEGNLLGALFNQNVNPILGFLAQAFIIIGIIMFIKQAPGIIKEITGLDGGKYSVFGSAFKTAAMLGGGVTAAVRNWNTDNPDGSQKKFGEKLRSAAGGFGSAAFRSTMHRDDVKGLKDVERNAHNSAEEAIKKRIARENAKRERDSYFESIGKPVMENRGVLGKAAGAVKYKAHSIAVAGKEWASGSFEVQQQILNEVNEFMKDAKAVKSTTEGFVRDKKYLFSMVGKGEAPTSYNTSTGMVTIDEKTSLSATEAIIETLKSSGNAEDAKIADKINNDMQQRIKTIGQNMTAVSIDEMSEKEFNDKFMIDKEIKAEAAPTLANAKSQYTIVQQKMAKNSSLDAVVTFKKDKGDLKPENVSKLADSLETQAAQISQKIKLEQERRKNAPKGGKD